MNKQIQNYLEKKNFQISESLATGLIDNYSINVFCDKYNKTYPLSIHIATYLETENKKNVINEIKNSFPQISITGDGFGLILGLQALTNERLVELMDEVLTQVVYLIRVNGALDNDYCCYCGKAFNDDKILTVINGLNYYLHDECKQQIQSSIRHTNIAFDRAPNNYGKGILGALLGAFIGLVVFEILYALNFFSALSSFVGIALGTFFYQKFGGKPTKMMVLIVSCFTFAFLLGDLFFMYVRSSEYIIENLELTSGYGLSGFEAFGFLLKNSNEFKNAFISDLIINIIFCIVGAVYEIITLLQKIKGNRQYIK